MGSKILTKSDERAGVKLHAKPAAFIGREIHPAANCFPMMPEPRLTELAADIQRNGLLQPIVIFEGKILDGRNREQACALAGVTPSFVDWNGENPFRFVWSVNSQRRDLDVMQRAAIKLDIDDKARSWDRAHSKREQGKKKSEAVKDQPRNSGKFDTVGGSGEPPTDRNHAKERHGDRHALSPAERRAEEIRKHDPELLRRVASGEVKRAQLGDKIRALPEGKFRVLYVDPPWKYGDERVGENVRSDSAAADHYPTMATEKICDFSDENGRHASDLAAPDAVLFMWATFPLLEDALRVVTAWKFNYKTAIVWHKQRSNVSHYHDASCELLLICTRGSCPIEIDTRVGQMQSIARGAHSAKPEEFRALIDKLYPSGPRVELFRRGTPPAGWVIWGNEAEAA